MQTFTKKKEKIPNKLHRYRENALLKASSPSSPSEELQNKIILKFAPKYSRSLRLGSWKDAKLINALRRIKKADKVNEKSDKGSRQNQWRLILQNKSKTVQVYNYDRNLLHGKEALQKYKTFLNVREIFFDMTSRPFSEKEGEDQTHFTRSLLRYLHGMRKIKDVDLELSRETDPDVLEKLNSMSSFLSSLENLRINCDSDRHKELSILPRLTKCRHILKAITHLSIESTSKVEAGELFECLLEHSKNLASLSLSSSLDSELKFLKGLKNSEKLEDFQIALKNLFSFVENFTPPASLKHITIDSIESSWKETSEKFFSQDLDDLEHSAVKDLFENDRRLTFYFDKWNDLKNLVSLRLFISQDSEEVFSILLFLKHLLKNIPTLHTLDLYFQYCYGHYFGGTDLIFQHYQMVDISLSEVFEALQDISKKLKTLKLSIGGGHSIDCYSIPDNFSFPQFTEVKFLKYSVCSSGVIETLFDAVKGSGVDQKCMEISMFQRINGLDHDNDSLLEILETIYKPPRNCRIDVNIAVYDLDLESFDEIFNPFIEKGRNGPVVENVSLTVESHDYLEELSFLGEVFRNVRLVNQRT